MRRGVNRYCTRRFDLGAIHMQTGSLIHFPRGDQLSNEGEGITRAIKGCTGAFVLGLHTVAQGALFTFTSGRMLSKS
jgi:hypothetical protein